MCPSKVQRVRIAIQCSRSANAAVRMYMSVQCIAHSAAHQACMLGLTSCLTFVQESNLQAGQHDHFAGDEPHATIRDNAEGTYTVSWSGKYAGIYAVRIQLDGASVGGTPFNCNVLPTAISPEQCDVQANSTSLVRAGERAEFRIIARDAFGNVRSQGGDEFAVMVRMVEGPGKTEVQANVTEESKGFYKAAFVVKHTGIYQVLVTADGQPIKGVPFKVTVNSGKPDFTKCKLGGPGLQAVRLGQPCDVLVELYDIYSNRITSALDALSDIQACPFLALGA